MTEDTDIPERIREKSRELDRAALYRKLLLFGGLLVLLALTAAGLRFVEFTVGALYRNLPGWLEFVAGFLPPDFVDLTRQTKDRGIGGLNAILQTLLHPQWFVSSILEAQLGSATVLVSAAFITVLMGFLGTVLGFPLALTFGILGSERVIPFPFNFVFRGVMSTIRAVPAIVWGLIFVPLTGFGPVTGVLAITTDTIGNLGRLLTDELEEVEDGPIEAVRSTGASGPQTIVFGMLSQVYNGYVAWTLYVLEINTRIAIGLGVIGVGGLGQYIDAKIRLGAFGTPSAYPEAAAGIVVVIAIVLTVEIVSSRIRSYLRPGEDQGRGILEILRSLGDANRWLGTRNPKD